MEVVTKYRLRVAKALAREKRIAEAREEIIKLARVYRFERQADFVDVLKHYDEAMKVTGEKE